MNWRTKIFLCCLLLGCVCSIDATADCGTSNTNQCLFNAQGQIVKDLRARIIGTSVTGQTYVIHDVTLNLDYPAPSGTTPGTDPLSGNTTLNFPQNGFIHTNDTPSISIGTGFTVLVIHSGVESFPSSGGSDVGFWTTANTTDGNVSVMMGAQPTNTGLKWSVGKSLLESGKAGTAYWQSPWDLNLLAGTGAFRSPEFVYYTFTPDGKVHVDRFVTYRYLVLFTAYEWDEAILDGGFPHQAFPQGTPSSPPGAVTYDPIGQIVIGAVRTPTGASPTTTAPQPLPGFERTVFFGAPLSTSEIVAYQNNLVGSYYLNTSMLPCNTGMYLQGTVSTPCGTGGPGNPPSNVATVYQNPEGNTGVNPVVLSTLANPPTAACASVTADQTDSNGLNTTAIQNQINSCSVSANGQTQYVELSAANGSSFLSGPLVLQDNVTLWLDQGIVLNASTFPNLFQRSGNSPAAQCNSSGDIPVCGSLSASDFGCLALVNSCQATNVGVAGLGSIEGHGWDTISDSSGSLGTTWWARSATAKAGNYAQNLSAPALIDFNQSKTVSLQGITLQNAPRYQVTLTQTDGATISNVTIHTPTADHVAQGPAYNTDGIDPISSTNVDISNVSITSGDDNISIKAGSNGPSSNITIANSIMYAPGHGLSIGSQTNGGVNNVTATDVNFHSTVNGIRIKSASDRGGTVAQIKYDHVCMFGVSDAIDIDPNYVVNGIATSGSLFPDFQSIEIDNMYTDGGTALLNGWSTSLPLGLTLNNVIFDGANQASALNANISEILDPKYPRALTIASDSGGSVTQSTGTHTVSNGIDYYCQTNNPRHPTTVVVAANGSGDFTTIQAAVNAAPADGSTIMVKPGTYNEVVAVTNPYIQIRGTSKDPSQVVITFNNSSGTLDSTGTPLGTSKSATFFAKGDNFYMENVTIQNTFDQTNGQDATGDQAVALFTSADRAVFRNIRVLGMQDTLYVDNKGCDTTTQLCQPARQYFANSYIAGNVDYVFGAAKAVFDTCEFHSVMHDTVSGEITITAQSRQYSSQDSGFVFTNSTLTSDSGTTNIYLGRPWKPYSTVVLLNTNMSSEVNAAGWQEWVPGITNYLSTAFYAEYESTGLGAAGPRESSAVALTAAQASQYNTTTYLAGADGWDPTTIQ